MKLNKARHQINRYRNIDFDNEEYVIRNYVKGNKAIIPIYLEAKDDLYSKYHPDKLVLNHELLEYIENVVYYIPYRYSIVLKISGVTFSEEEKIEVVKLLSNHFGLHVHDKKVDIKFNTHKAIILFALGLLILYISYLLSGIDSIKFITDVISIAGTFAIWELVNTLWLERNSLKIARLNAGQLACSTIEFDN